MHMIRKTITLREDQWRFAKHAGMNVSAVARGILSNAMADNDSADLPSDDSRRHKFSRKRTTITIGLDHNDFIQEEQVNIAQAIQDQIQAHLDCRLHLQHAETGDSPVVSQRHARIINEAMNGNLTPDD